MRVDMKKFKAMKPVIIIFCSAIIITAACLIIFRTRTIGNIIGIDNQNVKIDLVTIFNAPEKVKYTQVYASKDENDVEKVKELLSSATARLVGWKPLTGALPLYTEEKNIYAIVIDDGTDYNKVLDYANGYLYYNNSKYKVTAEEADKFLKDLETLISDAQNKPKQ